MKNFITFFVKYPIWTWAIKLLIMGFGLLALVNLKSSFFPERESKAINVNLIYPGASPEEIEKGVIQKIEDNLKGVQGIEKYESTSKENSGAVNIEVFQEYNTDEVLQDVKNAVDRINSFPIGLEPPVVAKRPQIEFAFSFAIYGDVDLKTLKLAAQDIEDDLREIPDISQVELSGFPEEEIVLAVSEENLRRYNITFDRLVAAIRTANIDLSAGAIKTESEEILIRLENKEYYAEQMQDIVVLADKDGRKIRVRDIGEIRNTWAENPLRSFVNNRPAAYIVVNKLYGENILDITEKAREYVEAYNENPDKPLKAEIINDASESLNGRIDMLVENGLIGALLVILTLTIFINWRLAMWVAFSIPFCFLGMFGVALLTNITINVMSLFGCIVVVGILVDDGIVVAEQIYQKYEQGISPFKAAIEGTMQVLKSVFFAVITTVVAFLPFYFIDTPGPKISDMSFVVIFTLLFSLLEVMFIMPTHLAHSKALQARTKEPFILRQKIDAGFQKFKINIYGRALDLFLKHKIVPIVLTVAFTILTISALQGKIINFTLFPSIDRDNFEINIELNAGARETETMEVLNKIEDAIKVINEKIKKERGIEEDIITRVVKNLAATRGNWGTTDGSGSNSGYIQVQLADENIRNKPSLEIASMVQKEVGPIPNIQKAEFGASSFFGKPVSFTLVGRNLIELSKAKEEIKQKMGNYSELRDITDNDPQGYREIQIDLKEKAYLLGLTPNEVARQIRQAFFGEEVQRIQRGQDEVKIWVKYNVEDRSSFDNFEKMRIRTQNGDSYPVSELISYQIIRGPVQINHTDGMRQIAVEAEIVDTKIPVPGLIAKIREEVVEKVLAKYPSVKTIASGQEYRANKFKAGTVFIAIALVIMFFLISLSFHSFLQAFLVLALVPLGVFGAMWGHVFQGHLMSLMSWYGVIALTGIIVNDSIVLVNQFNDNVRDGMNFFDAVKDAAISRFRPIILTTLTTVLGLLPLLSETSVQAQFLIPMATSVAFGLLFASLFVLLLLPSLLIILNTLKVKIKWLITGDEITPLSVEPAYIEQKNIKKYLNER